VSFGKGHQHLNGLDQAFRRPTTQADGCNAVAVPAGREARDPAPRWFVAETLPRKEVLAVEHLRRQAFQSFCPRFRKLRSHARKREQVLVPLFPNYVFVRFDPDCQPWRSINGTLGVRHLIGSERNRPQPMPAAAMEYILTRCDDDVVTQLVDQPRTGQAVRIVSGPFTDSLASIETMDDRGRVSVLLDILGRRASVRLTLDSLAPV
jgi:transcriptional antiterminator RfaH